MNTHLLDWPHLIFRDLSIFVAVLVASAIALLIVVAKLPKNSPLGRNLTVLCQHMGLLASIGILAIPVLWLLVHIYQVPAPHLD